MLRELAEEPFEGVLIREVAALNAEVELGAENPVLELDPPPPELPVTALDEEATCVPALFEEPEPVDDEPPVLELLAADDELVVLDADDERPPTIELAVDPDWVAAVTCTLSRFRPFRFARNGGVVSMTNFSAAVTPLNRMVFSTLPPDTVAVRIAALAEIFADSEDRYCCQPK